MKAVSGIVSRLDELNNKATEVNTCLELMCKQRGLQFISHCQTKSNHFLNSNGIRIFPKKISNFLLKFN